MDAPDPELGINEPSPPSLLASAPLDDAGWETRLQPGDAWLKRLGWKHLDPLAHPRSRSMTYRLKRAVRWDALLGAALWLALLGGGAWAFALLALTHPGGAMLLGAVGLHLALLVYFYARYLEPALTSTAVLRIAAQNAPASGLRVVFMSDFHIGRPPILAERIADLVRRSNELKPDLVVLGGDFPAGHRAIVHRDPDAWEEIEEAIAGFGALRARHGVVALLGNHDWQSGGPRVAALLEACGACVLDNAHCVLDLDGAPLVVAGLADMDTREPDLDRAMRGAPRDAPVLLLTHAPDPFVGAAKALGERVIVGLAGHTHGGQIALPFLRAPFLPTGLGELAARGLRRFHGRPLYVSHGVGLSGPPMRLLAPPELVCCDLVRP